MEKEIVYGPLLKHIVMKHYHIILAAILIGSLATSCKIGKKYTRPELDLPTTIGMSCCDDSLCK